MFHVVEYGAVVSVAINVVPWKNDTLATAMLSDAVAEIVTVFDTEPPVGDVRETAGAVMSGLLTVTDTVEEVAVLPAASRAVAFKTYAPFAIEPTFHNAEYGADVSVPMSVVP